MKQRKPLMNNDDLFDFHKMIPAGIIIGDYVNVNTYAVGET